MNSLNKNTVKSVQCCVVVFMFSLLLHLNINHIMMCQEDIAELISKLTFTKLSLDIPNDNCNYITMETIESLPNKTSDLKILEWNIRGLLGKQDQIKSLLNNTITPGAVLVCETWLK